MMRPTTQPRDGSAWLSRVFLWGVLGAVLTGVMGLGLWSVSRHEPPAPLLPGTSSARLPVYGSVPDFSLIDQNSRPVRKADLEGKIWIADFIFTTCPDECPLMTAEMARLHSDLADVQELRLVSITVDPEHDTPAVLSRYAERFHADPERWLFLTGEKRAIYRLAREGFRLSIVDPAEQPQPSPIKGSAINPFRRALEHRRPEFREGVFGWTQNFHSWRGPLKPSPAFADHGRAKDPLHSARFVLVDHGAQIRGYYDSREDVDLRRLRQHLQILRRDT
jgi:cytochrome oxidase Cu insertion factor (SCO1/SenC/PrrC family)